MKFSQIAENLILITLQSHKDLASALVRFQEYYESPFPEIRNNVFTLGYLRSLGSRNLPGVFTYEGGNHIDTDWGGYNFPSYVLDPFIKGLFDPLTSFEADIVSVLRNRPGKFYIIGTIEDVNQTSSSVLDHEICHGLYYLNSKYKSAVDQVLKDYDLRGLKKSLKSMGYCEEVLDDECHAYLSADYDWICQYTGLRLDRTAHVKLRKIKQKYFK